MSKQQTDIEDRKLKHGWIRISTKSFTCSIDVRDNIVTNPAPILKKFNGQPISNLFKWINKNFPTFKWEEYGE